MFYKVIFVDDDPVALLLSKLVLSKTEFAHNFVTVCNGQEAITFFENFEKSCNLQEIANQPILVMLDLNMPIMDGWEFLDEFTTQYLSKFPNVKIILLSSSVDPEDVKKSKNYSVVHDFYPKPFTKEMALEIKSKYL